MGYKLILKSLSKFLAGIGMFYYGVNTAYLAEILKDNILLRLFISVMVWFSFFGLLAISELLGEN